MADVVTSWDKPQERVADTTSPAPVVGSWDEKPAEQPRSSNTAVVRNAAYKGVAGVGDMVLNAPNNVMNLLKATYGFLSPAEGTPLPQGGTMGAPPEPTPNPDLARKGLEAVGLINPQIVPQGSGQQAADILTQGAVGGALTGGASIPRAVAGAGFGALSAGASGATHALTGNDALAASAGLAVPAGAARVAGGGGKPLPADKQLLKDEGVTMTLGQIKGGTTKRLEDAATSIPFLGDMIKGAQRRSVETFNAAAINRSLAPIGEKLPAGMTGNKAIEYAYDKLGDKYDALLPNLKGDLHARPSANALPAPGAPQVQMKPTFADELHNIRTMGNSLPEPQRGQLNRIIDREVLERFTPQGKASGEVLKDIESKLGSMSKKMGRSDDYDIRTLGDGVQEIQNAMRRMVNDVNPSHHGELAKINEGYANFKKVQAAAANVNTTEGVFSPRQLHGAVRAGDSSKDKARFAEGNALMQDLSTAGKAVLPSTVPDSGTPLRAALMYTMTHPLKAAGMGVPLSMAMLPYTSMGQRFTQHMTTNPNAHPSQVANRVSPVATDIALESLNRKK